MHDRRINCAIVGYGLSAKVFHIPLIEALPDDFNLYAIVQRTPKPHDDVRKDHPEAKHFSSIEDVYTDPKVDLVVLTTIPDTHFSMCKAALEAGKHVVVEKPFVPTAAEAKQLVGLSKKCGKTIAVYQNRRWDQDFLTLCQVLREGSLGAIAEFETHFDRHRPEVPPLNWKVEDIPGHGSVYDLGAHLIDQAYHLFGMPQRVTGFIGNQRRGVHGGAHDSHTALLHYKDGFVVTSKASVISPEAEQLRYWVRGTKGSFKKFHLDVQEDQLKDGLRPGAKGFGVDPEDHWAVVTTWADGKLKKEVFPSVTPATYVEYYRLLATALRGERGVPVSAQEATDVLTIIEAVIQSSKDGKTVTL